jgi:sugar/nucleoside kinase (ribokinase family)
MKEKTIDVLTFADLCVDTVVDVNGLSLSFGQKEQISRDYNLTMGGSCSIFSHQTAALGLRTAVVGRMGRDPMGKFLLDAHRKSSIITDHIILDDVIKTCVSFCLARGNDRAIITAGDSITAVTEADINYDLLSSTRHLHIGSFFLLEGLRSHWKMIIHTVKKNGGTVSLDVNWDPEEKWDGIADLLPLIDIFFPNEQEALSITNERNLENAVKALTPLVKTLVVKKGSDGADLYTGDGKWYEPSVDYKPFKDAIGAGDSFAGGFVFGYLSGRSPQDCLKIGSICGSLSTSETGGTPGQPDADMVNKILHY